jgi:branched-chain amino acid transport system permease protein
MSKGHLPRAPISTDVTTLDRAWLAKNARAMPQMVVAGFPCVGFSSVGLRTGLEDAQSKLFGEIVRIFMNNLNSPLNITNGPQGISNIDPISIAGVNLGKTQVILGVEVPSVHLYYYLFLVLTIAIIVLTIRLQDSRLGRAWMAIREDEIAAKAMGINTRNVKLLAFAMGASFGGVAGAMFSAFQGFVSPESFTLMESIVIVAMVVLGGMGHVPGVILGEILLYAIPEVLRFVAKPAQEMLFGQELIAPEALRMLLFGLAMVVIMLYRPAGLWPAPRHGDTRRGVAAPDPDKGNVPPSADASAVGGAVAAASADGKIGGAR